MRSNYGYMGTIPPTIQEVKDYFSQRCMPDLEADHFFLFYEKKEWKSKRSKPFNGWKNLAWNWIRSALIISPWLFN
jgi:hypothetical protein